MTFETDSSVPFKKKARKAQRSAHSSRTDSAWIVKITHIHVSGWVSRHRAFATPSGSTPTFAHHAASSP